MATNSASDRRFDRLGEPEQKLESNLDLSEVVQASLALQDVCYVLVFQNTRTIFDIDNIIRIEKGLCFLEDRQVPWSVAGGAGLCIDGNIRNVLYSSQFPTLPIGGGYHPVRDLFPDVLLFERSATEAALKLCGDVDATFGFELVVIVSGYLQNKVALFAPFLAIGIDGPYLERDGDKATRLLETALGDLLQGQTITTFLGPIVFAGSNGLKSPPRLVELPLEKIINKCILEMSANYGVSIITRTRFTRNHLLRRLLTSASRARGDSSKLEIILVSDVNKNEIDGNVAQLQLDFPNISIVGVHNDRAEHSRVGNLIEGVACATQEYILVVDDDDYIDPRFLESARNAHFLGQMPLIFADSVVHDEKWEVAGNGRNVLAHSARRSVYSRDGWRYLFGGVNQLPICSAMVPTTVARDRLAAAPLRYDLSEDYAFFLLLLTDPALPDIYEVTGPFCHISIRASDDNTVTSLDRSQWTHDISGFLFDIVTREAGGKWQLLTTSFAKNSSIAERAALARIAELEHQNRELVSLLGRMKIEISRLSA